jgi:hypothetical protein
VGKGGGEEGRLITTLLWDGERGPQPIFDYDRSPPPPLILHTTCDPVPHHGTQHGRFKGRKEEGGGAAAVPRVEVPPTLHGCMPLRGDFDIEWDNDAELLLADMEFHEVCVRV